jgi:hypothetical protein
VSEILMFVPQVALSGDNGLNPLEKDKSDSSGVLLAMRMVQVAVGVTVGIFTSQSIVYAIKSRRTAARFMF